MNTKQNKFKMETINLPKIAKHISIFRDTRGWYYKIFFGLIKIRFSIYNTNLFNSMYHLQTERKNINEDFIPNELSLIIIFDIIDLYKYFDKFTQFYQITKMSPFYKSWYYCNIFDMEKSILYNFYHIKTGINENNESYNKPVKLGWLFRFKLTGKLRNTFNSSIYIRI